MTDREALQAVWDLGDELDSNHTRWAASQIAERLGIDIDRHNKFSGPPRNRNEEQIEALREEVAILRSEPTLDEGLTYETRVEQMAVAIHADCVLRADAEYALDPVPDPWHGDHHDERRHYGQAHALVRRIFPELDGARSEPTLDEGLREAALAFIAPFTVPDDGHCRTCHGYWPNGHRPDCAYDRLAAVLAAQERETP